MPLDLNRYRSLTDRLLDEYDRTGTLPAISGGDHDDDSPVDDPSKDDSKPTKPDGITDEIQAYFSNIVTRETRKAADKAKADLQADLDRKRQQEDADRQREADEEKGEYEKAKATLTGERDTAVTERDALKSENEALTTYFASQYEAALKDLPDVITAFAPDDDASFTEKSAWLAKAQEQAKKLPGEKTPGHLPNPKPSHGRIDEKAAQAHARRAVRPI